MKKLNNKGFTLVEVLAVIAILSTLLIIFVPNVLRFYFEFQDKSVDKLKDSILVATKDFVADKRYEFTYVNYVNGNDNVINWNDSVKDGKVTLKFLIENGYLSASGKETNVDGCTDETYTSNCYFLRNPKTNEKIKLTEGIVVTYDGKKFNYDKSGLTL